MTTSKYYVMFMPNDDYLVRKEGEPHIEAEEHAIDCYTVEASSKNHALGKVLRMLYNKVRTVPPANYTDPNAQNVKDAIDRAVAAPHTVDTCQACRERSLGL